ncbi:MAG TPA: sugar phosphate nucleotidyltransferase, partial [Saprospiraceae bacterium]
KSLIRQTVDRFLSFIPKENIYVITHKNYGSLVLEAIPELAKHQVIEEPSRNNTAASVALASMKLYKLDPDAVCIVAPADHLIKDEQAFKEAIAIAVKHATQFASIITLGIEPTRADTGYGYIEFDKTDDNEVRAVKSFREKPDKTKAEQYLNQGSFAWNAGIFIWKLSVILNSFEQHASQIYKTLHPGINVYNTDEEHSFIASEYPKTEKISVDYAILERAQNVFTIPCDIGWSDLGTWTSLYDQSEKDKAHNVNLSQPVFLEKATNNLILSKKDKLVVIKGLEDFIVIDTEDCLMIYPKSEEQSIKELKERLKDNGLDAYL